MLFSDLERFAENTAIIDELGSIWSYERLLAHADALVAPLGRQRQLIVIECSPCLSVVAAYVGALRAGHVVMLAAGQDTLSFETSVRLMQPQHIYRRGEDGAYHFWATGALPVALHDDLALILSTSGSAGAAKHVRLSHQNLQSNALAIADYLKLGADERGITCLPIHYAYGLSVLNSHLAVGASVVLSGKSVNDISFWDDVDALRVTNFQGVPHSFQLLARSGHLERRHPSLRFFAQAGGRLEPEMVEAFARRARDSHCRFYVMYGQTEASPRMAYLPPEDVLTHSDTIGQAIPGGSLSVEHDGRSLARGQAGELVYRGDNVMMGYASGPEDLALPKQTDVLHTGDIAVQTEAGYFRIVGRASRFIKPFGLRLNLDEIEAQCLKLGQAVAATGTDECLVLALLKPARPKLVEAYIKETLKLPASAFKVIEVSAFPRLASDKIDYPRLLEMATSALSSAPKRELTLIEEMHELLGDEIDPKKSFVDLQVDSLNYVYFSLIVEKRLGCLPPKWEVTPLNVLEARAQNTKTPKKPKFMQALPVDVALRALLIVLVILHHVTAWNMYGSAHALLALAGYNFARFQLPKVLAGNTSWVLRNLILKVILPYFIILAPIMVLMGHVYWPQFLFYSNFIPHGAIGLRPPTLFWYIETYVVLIFVFTMISSMEIIKSLIRKHPVGLALGLFVIAAILRVQNDIYPDNPLYVKYTPVAEACVFVFGWLVHVLKSRAQPMWIALLILPFFYVFKPAHNDIAPFYFIPSMLVLMYVATVPFVRSLSVLITLIASSALYIYMGQPFMLNAFEKLFGRQLLPEIQPAALLACLALGIALKAIVDKTILKREAFRALVLRYLPAAEIEPSL